MKNFKKNGHVRKKIITSLEKIKVAPNEQVLKIFSDNTQFFNGLLKLYKALKECDIELTREIHTLIQKNPSKAGAVADLLDFLMKEPIRLNLIQKKDIPGLFEVCLKNAEELFRSAVSQLSKKSSVLSSALKLFYTYPEASMNLSVLILKLIERLLDSGQLVSKLEKIPHINDFGELIDFLIDVVEQNEFYFSLVDILLKQTNSLKNILIGAKLLLDKNILSDEYFEVIKEKNAENSILIAKSIILLKNKSLINPASKKDLLICCQINKEAFFFLQQLEKARRLNLTTYKLVFDNCSLLSKDSFLASSSNNSLFVTLSDSDLDKVIERLGISNKSSINASSL